MRRIVYTVAAFAFAACAAQPAPDTPSAKPAGAWKLEGRAMVSAADKLHNARSIYLYCERGNTFQLLYFCTSLVKSCFIK